MVVRARILYANSACAQSHSVGDLVFCYFRVLEKKKNPALYDNIVYNNVTRRSSYVCERWA